MFFKTLKREITLVNLFNMIVLLIIFFSPYNKLPYIPENNFILFPVSNIHSVIKLLIPLSFIYYFYFTFLAISSLNRLSGRLNTIRDYKFYITSSAIYMFLYLLIFTTILFIAKKIILYSLNNSLTDSSMVLWVLITITTGSVIAKLLTFAKLMTRTLYYKEKDTITLSTYFKGFLYLTNLKYLILFFIIVGFVAGIPFACLILGVVKSSILLTVCALILTLTFSSTGKLYLYYFFWNKLSEKNNIEKPDNKNNGVTEKTKEEEIAENSE